MSYYLELMALQELWQVYESKTDEELLLVARDFEGLTLEAQGALRNELSRRGLETIEVAQTHVPEEAARRLPPRVIETAEFLVRVTRLYRDRFLLFLKLITPAVVLGYVAVQIVRPQIHHSLLQSYSEGTISRGAFFLGAVVVAQVAYIVSWTVFCISFALICSAVARISEGFTPKSSECFRELSERKWKFSKIVILLYLALGTGSALCTLIFIGLWKLIPYLHTSTQVVSYALWMVMVLAISRLALAIPAVILDNKSVRQSIFLSDELTEGKWAILFALLCKSVIGGYIVGMLPFWIATWTGADVNPWLLRIASSAAVACVEPIMFIGFSLLYVTGTASEEPRNVPQSVFAPHA